MQPKSNINDLCVVVGSLVEYACIIIVNINVKQNDLPNTNNNELVVQEVLLENLKKWGKDWKPHHRNSTTWAFFKVNNN
jgi:hypothetical protein